MPVEIARALKKDTPVVIEALGTVVPIASVAIKPRLDDSLALFADVVARPRLDDKDIERVRGKWLASIKQEKARPNTLARRLVGPALFGAGHPYAIPLSGTGTEPDIAALKRDDLTRWMTQWVRPDNATLLVVGDTSLAELTPRLEKVFAAWKAPATPLGGFPIEARTSGAVGAQVQLPSAVPRISRQPVRTNAAV